MYKLIIRPILFLFDPEPRAYPGCPRASRSQTFERSYQRHAKQGKTLGKLIRRSFSTCGIIIGLNLRLTHVKWLINILKWLLILFSASWLHFEISGFVANLTTLVPLFDVDILSKIQESSKSLKHIVLEILCAKNFENYGICSSEVLNVSIFEISHF